jgi:hypothetical protein
MPARDVGTTAKTRSVGSGPSTTDTLSTSESVAPEQKPLTPSISSPSGVRVAFRRVSRAFTALPQNQRCSTAWPRIARLLRLGAEQQDAGHLQVLEAEQVRQRAVGLREAPQDAEDRAATRLAARRAREGMASVSRRLWRSSCRSASAVPPARSRAAAVAASESASVVDGGCELAEIFVEGIGKRR